jgi:hypothetical protein
MPAAMPSTTAMHLVSATPGVMAAIGLDLRYLAAMWMTQR